MAELNYPSTDKFKVIDTIGVPHPYCITPKHLTHSPTMILDIAEAERRSKEAHPNDPRRWAVCETCRLLNKKTGKNILPYEEHKRALLIEVDDPGELKDVPGLSAYLLVIQAQAAKEGYAGFAFTQKK